MQIDAMRYSRPIVVCYERDAPQTPGLARRAPCRRSGEFRSPLATERDTRKTSRRVGGNRASHPDLPTPGQALRSRI